jgi:hypothetical protein
MTFARDLIHITGLSIGNFLSVLAQATGKHAKEKLLKSSPTDSPHRKDKSHVQAENTIEESALKI